METVAWFLWNSTISLEGLNLLKTKVWNCLKKMKTKNPDPTVYRF